MALPLEPPVLPQLANPAKELPDGEGWSYEPKWDGFRVIVFVDGPELYLQSRNGKPLLRYFPELRFPAGRYVLDGELVILDGDGNPDFDKLGERIHPAQSRVDRLAKETPTTFMAFDLLADGDEVLLELPQRKRRERLEARVGDPVVLTPSVRTAAEAERWLHTSEGVIAKELDAPYLPGERRGMVKIRRTRTADCVVMGWRPGKAEGTVGALILGLYGSDGRLHSIGHTSSFTAQRKKELVDELRPLETGERGTADPSRWTQGRDLAWVALRPELVAEVTFDHVAGGRIRHGARFVRFRPDRDASSCSLAQFDG